MADYIDLPVTPKVKLTTLPTDPAYELQDGEAFIGGTKYTFRHIKQEEEEVDFRRYIFMEPEGDKPFAHLLSALIGHFTCRQC